MTIKEALKNRIPRIRKPIWANSEAYLRLPLLPNGFHGPWAELYDVPSQIACDIPAGTQHIFVLFGDHVEVDDDYVIYDGPVSRFEQEEGHYAKVYTEN